MQQLDRQRLKDLFSLALELPNDARPDFLRESCAGDAALRRELESLLAAYDEPHPLIERDDFAAASVFGAAGANYEGRRFGRYRVVREIGRGGMGAVFLAERADGEFEQRVALKVVRRGFADPDLARRFRRERQILATLSHENVARLLDGGVSEDGEPFFVMEHVEGARLDDYCDANRLGTDARLRLFLKVCDGVSYAHQRLVVHRDLKPSNVLVTASGTPKLLDFGIAKLLDPEQAGDETRTEHRAFTPEYASPEQARGESVTTATDVFSLGVLLRNLLQANDARRARRRVEEWRARGGSDGRTVAANLPTRPEDGGAAETQHGLLGAELRNIVRVATREEADRRYPSVAALAEDVRRYLAGLPVRAQKDSFTYRAGKFVRRNRLPVAAAALVALSLVVGASAAAWQARVASEGARVAAENQRRAEFEAARSKKITGFLQRVLSHASPAWYAEGHQQRGQARIIDVLNNLGGMIETDFPDDPDLRAELNHKCAEIFLANHMFEPAETHARRALDLRRRVYGERHAEVAKDVYYLGAILVWSRSFDEGMGLFRESAAMFREVAPDNVNLPYLLEDLGSNVSSSHGDLGEAERLLSESLELFRRHDGDAHANTARLYMRLAHNAARKKEFERAEVLFREGEARLARQSSAIWRALPILTRGEIELVRGDYRLAEANVKQYLAEARSILGENRGGEEAYAEQVLLKIYDHGKQWAKAVELARADVEAEKKVSKVSSETSPEFSTKLAILSLYLMRDGRAREGAIYFERARQGFRGGTPAQEAQRRLYLGECLLLLGRRDEALILLEEGRAFFAANCSPTHPQRIYAEELAARARDGEKQ